MALTQIDAYPKPHGNGQGGGTTIIKGGGKSSTYNSLNLNNINASKGNIDYLTSKTISANDAEFTYLLTREGTILKLTGNELKYNSGYIGALNSDDITTKKLKADDIEAINAYIKSLQSYEITTDYLTVTKQAHFFELVIDKIRSVGGIVILTPASCEIDFVRAHLTDGRWLYSTQTMVNSYSQIDYFQVFWRAENEGRNVYNDFKVNDQAICQSLGDIHEGVNHDVANKYYWRLVKSIGYDSEHSQVYVNFTTGDVSTEEAITTDNNFQIIMYDTQSKSVNDQYYNNSIQWEGVAQNLIDFGIDTNVRWIPASTNTGEAVRGTFKTHSQQYGIYIKPKNESKDLPITEKLSFNIKQNVNGSTIDRSDSIIPKNINIGVYFNNDTYKIWQNVAIDDFDNLELDLENPNAPIERIIIVSTADVNWHLCNCMTIGNVYTAKSQNEPTVPAASSECDYSLLPKASIPAKGDNLVQLGYRGSDDAKRQSAIIIAAYQSPDKEITPPSYAQYMGINDFNLSSHRKTYFDANSAKFYGEFTIRSGGNETTIDNYIRGEIAEVETENMWKNSKIELEVNTVKYTINRDNTRQFSPETLIVSAIIYDSNGDPHSYYLNNLPSGYRAYFSFYRSDGSGYDNVWVGSTLPYNLFDQYNNVKVVELLQCADNDNPPRIPFIVRLYLVKGTVSSYDIIDIESINFIYNALDGEDGEDGEDAEVYMLAPLKETLMAGLINAVENNSYAVPLIYDLSYQITHVSGDSAETVSNWQTAGFSIVVSAYNGQFNEISVNNGHLYSGTVNGSTFNYNSTNNNNTTNLLEVINPASSYVDNKYRDYMKCYADSTKKSRCPVYLKVQLIKSNTVYDERLVYVQLETGAVFKVFDDKIVSAVADAGTGESGGASQEWVTNNFTKFEQTAYGFDLKVAGNTVVSSYDAQTIDDKISSIEITDAQINSVLQDNYYTKTQVEGAIQNAIGDPNYFSRELDLFTDTSFLNDSFYPVTVNVATGTNVEENGPMITCQVDCSLDEFNYSSSSRPSWGGLYPQDSHNRGVALICNWNAFCNKHGEWNGNEKNVYINTYELKYTRKSGGSNYDADNTTNNIKVIGGTSDSSGIVQNNGYLIFYLRGGAKYNFRFNWPNLTATVNKNPITINGTTYAVKTESQIYVPTLDRMWKSQILQEADRISLNVWSGDGVTLPNTSEGAGYTYLRNCGIDIGTREIKLKADKVKFTNTAGTVDDKIWIDPTTGTLNAENANISGKFNFKVTYQDVGDLDSSTTATVSNLHSFYVLGGQEYQSYTFTFPEAGSVSGLQIQMFKPKSPTRTPIGGTWTLATQSGNKFWLQKADGLGNHNITSFTAPMCMMTFIAVGNYWYEVSHLFTDDELSGAVQ